jgi:hypothetical protein
MLTHIRPKQDSSAGNLVASDQEGTVPGGITKNGRFCLDRHRRLGSLCRAYRTERDC